MPRLPIRGMPWLMALQAGMIAREHWGKLDSRDRAELQALVRKSRGRASNLNDKERRRARALFDKLELATLGRSLVPVATGLRKKRRI